MNEYSSSVIKILYDCTPTLCVMPHKNGALPTHCYSWCFPQCDYWDLWVMLFVCTCHICSMDETSSAGKVVILNTKAIASIHGVGHCLSRWQTPPAASVQPTGQQPFCRTSPPHPSAPYTHSSPTHSSIHRMPDLHRHAPSQSSPPPVSGTWSLLQPRSALGCPEWLTLSALGVTSGWSVPSAKSQSWLTACHPHVTVK